MTIAVVTVQAFVSDTLTYMVSQLAGSMSRGGYRFVIDTLCVLWRGFFCPGWQRKRLKESDMSCHKVLSKCIYFKSRHSALLFRLIFAGSTWADNFIFLNEACSCLFNQKMAKTNRRMKKKEIKVILSCIEWSWQQSRALGAFSTL